MDKLYIVFLSSMLLLASLQLCRCKAISNTHDTFILIPDAPSQGFPKQSSSLSISKPDNVKTEQAFAENKLVPLELNDKRSLHEKQGQLRYGKEAAPHLRYGKEVKVYVRNGREAAPHLRYGKEASDHVRYGREAAQHVRYGKEVKVYVRNGREAAPHLRYGKELSDHVRYGREAVQHVRYGKEAEDHVRYGKEAAQHVRYGKEIEDHVRYGKEAAQHVRYGKEAEDHVRYGKESAQHLRYGKEATDDVENMLVTIGDEENQQRRDEIKEMDEDEYKMLLKTLLLQNMIQTTEEQKFFEIMKLLVKEFGRRRATSKIESKLKTDEEA